MIIAPPCENEDSRLEALLRYKVLDTEAEGPYDDLVALASNICQRPIALISLVDKDRQWFKAKVGLDARQTHRDLAFCSHAIQQDDVFTVGNATEDERFCDNPLVTGEPNIRFYAGAPLITQDGCALGTICVIDRVPGELAEEQKQSRKILARQVVSQLELRLSNSQLQTLNKEKDNFIRVMSHDLRSAFGVAIGFSQMLIRRNDNMENQKRTEIIEKIYKSSTQGLNLLDNLLSWSFLQGDTRKLTHDKVDIAEVSGESIEYLSELASEKGVRVKLEGETQKILVNERLLRSVIQNLLHNAIKFSNSGSSVSLRLGDGGESTCITVLDQGIGMSAERAEQLFDGTIQTSVGTMGEPGSGIGTQLVKEFVELYHGKIEVSSRPDEGTSITIRLPNVNTA